MNAQQTASDYYATHAAASRRGRLWHRLVAGGSRPWLALTGCSIEIEPLEFMPVADMRHVLILCPRCWPTTKDVTS